MSQAWSALSTSKCLSGPSIACSCNGWPVLERRGPLEAPSRLLPLRGNKRVVNGNSTGPFLRSSGIFSSPWHGSQSIGCFQTNLVCSAKKSMIRSRCREGGSCFWDAKLARSDDGKSEDSWLNWIKVQTAALALMAAIVFPETSAAYGPRSALLEQSVHELPATISRLPGKLPKYIAEPSGIIKVPSPDTRAPYFWVHTDSGGPPKVWAMNKESQVLAEMSLVAKNVDWEDIAWGQCRNSSGTFQDVLIVGDTGNNFGRRAALKLYFISPPPDLTDLANSPPSSPLLLSEVSPSKVVKLTYPPGHPLDFDSEALFVFDGRIWLLSKRRSEHSAALYRLPADALASCSPAAPGSKDQFELEYVAEQETGNPVTAADVSEDGTVLAVLTTSDVILFDLSNSTNPLSRPIGRIGVEQLKQVEGVTWDAGNIIVTNEERETYYVQVQPPR